jgi:hypothetical protein
MVLGVSGLLLGACKPTGLSSSRGAPVWNPKGGLSFPNAKRDSTPAQAGHAQGGSGSSESFRAPSTSNTDATTYESTPLSENTKGLLNTQAFNNHLAGLSESSQSDCALRVREGLEKLFGAPIGGQGHAYEYNAETLNKFASRKGLAYNNFSPDHTPPFQDYDVRVLQPTPGGSEYGHIEIFYQGRWYSDFPQNSSLWDSSRGRYSTMKIYRLAEAGGIAMFLRRGLEIAGAWLIPSANAAEGDSKKIKTRRSEVALAPDKVGSKWKIIEDVRGEVPSYLLYREKAGKSELVTSDSEAFFFLLNKASELAPVSELADDFVSRWIKRDGKDSVQKQVSQITGLIEIQRDAYVRAGLELPTRYNLLVPNKN